MDSHALLRWKLGSSKVSGYTTCKRTVLADSRAPEALSARRVRAIEHEQSVPRSLCILSSQTWRHMVSCSKISMNFEYEITPEIVRNASAWWQVCYLLWPFKCHIFCSVLSIWYKYEIPWLKEYFYFSVVFTVWVKWRHLVDLTTNIDFPQVITPLRNFVLPLPVNIQTTTFRSFDQWPQTLFLPHHRNVIFSSWGRWPDNDELLIDESTS